jgi:glutamate synthase domain-containing protein 3
VLRARFTGTPEHVINYFFFVAEELREIIAALGVRRLDEVIGRVELLRFTEPLEHWKAKGVDLDRLLHQPKGDGPRCSESWPRRKISAPIDEELIALLDGGLPAAVERPITNVDRAVGARLSGEIATRFGHAGLGNGNLKALLRGTAGQSFGAFLVRGVTLELVGDANDYAGKGLAGGTLIARPPEGAPRQASDNIVVGNTCLYGAVAGEAFFSGVAGERFAVRNSGATAVVEGAGDHCCEYMTGGTVVVLGPVGRNFAAGMSGGVAYVWDPETRLDACCSSGAQVSLEPVDDDGDLHALVQRHFELTGSKRAEALLEDWTKARREFVLVMPHEYRRALSELEATAIAAE